MLKKLIFLYLIFALTITKSIAANNLFIVINVNDQIITNHDIKKEMDYLKMLNPKLTDLNIKKVFKISKDSLVNEIIKRKEVEKFIDLSLENPYVNQQLESLYSKLNFESISSFEKHLLNSSNYTLSEIKEKIKIEIAWNELIYFRYKDQLKIDKEKLLIKIDKFQKEVRNEYQLSEIVFNSKKNQDLESLIKEIKLSIKEAGFENTANIYSISDSSKLGGQIGWVNENNLSEKISKEFKNISKDQITNVIQIGNSYLILKINDMREINIPINRQDELNKMIKFETNKQLNQFSKIFFDKSKINYSINEK